MCLIVGNEASLPAPRRTISCPLVSESHAVETPIGMMVSPSLLSVPDQGYTAPTFLRSKPSTSESAMAWHSQCPRRTTEDLEGHASYPAFLSSFDVYRSVNQRCPFPL
jgi:hypothetical protein